MIGYINGNAVTNNVSETEMNQKTLKAFSFLGSAAGSANLIKTNKEFTFKGSSMDDFFDYITQKVTVFGNDEAKELMGLAKSFYHPQSRLREDMNSVISQFCLGIIVYHVEGLGKFQSKWHFSIKDGLGRQYNSNIKYLK